MSPDYAWWYGYADVLGHLAIIRDHAERLRGDASVRRQTLFIIWTGPLMGAVIIAAGWYGRRLWRRRRRG